MAVDFTGTNTDKLDKLIAAVVGLQTTARIWASVLIVCLPILTGVEAFLLSQTVAASAKMSQIEERAGQLEKRLDRVESRLDRIEQKLDRLSERVKPGE